MRSGQKLCHSGRKNTKSSPPLAAFFAAMTGPRDLRFEEYQSSSVAQADHRLALNKLWSLAEEFARR